MSINDIDFVARHYRRGLFSTKAAWRCMGITTWSGWRRFRAAAAIGAAVILSATAAVIFTQYRTPGESAVTEQTASPLAVVKAIDFEDAPLPAVVEKIEEVYGVKVEGLPALPESYTLSLHYEGTPADLISVINDILGTHMTVTEP